MALILLSCSIATVMALWGFVLDCSSGFGFVVCKCVLSPLAKF